MIKHVNLRLNRGSVYLFYDERCDCKFKLGICVFHLMMKHVTLNSKGGCGSVHTNHSQKLSSLILKKFLNLKGKQLLIG